MLEFTSAAELVQLHDSKSYRAFVVFYSQITLLLVFSLQKHTFFGREDKDKSLSTFSTIFDLFIPLSPSSWCSGLSDLYSSLPYMSV